MYRRFLSLILSMALLMSFFVMPTSAHVFNTADASRDHVDDWKYTYAGGMAEKPGGGSVNGTLVRMQFVAAEELKGEDGASTDSSVDMLLHAMQLESLYDTDVLDASSDTVYFWACPRTSNMNYTGFWTYDPSGDMNFCDWDECPLLYTASKAESPGYYAAVVASMKSFFNSCVAAGEKQMLTYFQTNVASAVTNGLDGYDFNGFLSYVCGTRGTGSDSNPGDIMKSLLEEVSGGQDGKEGLADAIVSYYFMYAVWMCAQYNGSTGSVTTDLIEQSRVYLDSLVKDPVNAQRVILNFHLGVVFGDNVTFGHRVEGLMTLVDLFRANARFDTMGDFDTQWAAKRVPGQPDFKFTGAPTWMEFYEACLSMPSGNALSSNGKPLGYYRLGRGLDNSKLMSQHWYTWVSNVPVPEDFNKSPAPMKPGVYTAGLSIQSGRSTSSDLLGYGNERWGFSVFTEPRNDLVTYTTSGSAGGFLMARFNVPPEILFQYEVDSGLESPAVGTCSKESSVTMGQPISLRFGVHPTVGDSLLTHFLSNPNDVAQCEWTVTRTMYKSGLSSLDGVPTEATGDSVGGESTDITGTLSGLPAVFDLATLQGMVDGGIQLIDSTVASESFDVTEYAQDFGVAYFMTLKVTWPWDPANPVTYYWREMASVDDSVTSGIRERVFVQFRIPGVTGEVVTEEPIVILKGGSPDNPVDPTENLIGFGPNFSVIGGGTTDAAMAGQTDWASSGEEFAEIKHNAPLSEQYEVQGGVPSSEEIYFSVGGSEYKVALVVQYWINTRSRDRTYTIHFDDVLCEYNNDKEGQGDRLKEWKPIAQPDPAIGGGHYNDVSIHCTNSDGYGSGDWQIQATWTYYSTNHEPENKAPCSTGCTEYYTHCVFDGATEEYNQDLEAAQKLADELSAEFVYWTAASDGIYREKLWDVVLDPGSAPSDGTNVGDPGAPGCGGQHNPCGGCFTCPGHGEDGACGGCVNICDPGAPCNAGGPCPGHGWTITVTATIPAHWVCGPCCGHNLPDLYDTWKQGLVYDFASIGQIRLFQLEQGAVTGMTELTGVDQIFSNVVSGNPTYFMNIALMNDKQFINADTGAVGTHKVMPQVSLPPTMAALWSNNFYYQSTNTASTTIGYHLFYGSQTSRAGRLRYTAEDGQQSKTFNYSEQGDGSSGSFTVNPSEVAAPWMHDDVIYEMGPRSRNCDGMSNHYNFGTNGCVSDPVSTTGHVHDWADGCLYTTTIQGKNYSSWYDGRSGGPSFAYITGAANDANAVNEYYYYQDYNHHILSSTYGSGEKTGYSDRADAKDVVTAEWKVFDACRRVKIVANVISDFLILQTSGGDQSLFYFEKKTEAAEAQAHLGMLHVTPEEMFDNNPLSIFTSPVSCDSSSPLVKNAEYDNELDNFIVVGGYNGRYDEPTKKYRPYSLVRHEFLNFESEGWSTYDAIKKTGTYKWWGNSKVKTTLDSDPAFTISRPKRQATSQNSSFKIMQTGIQILPTTPNGLYESEDCAVWYNLQVAFAGKHIGILRDLQRGSGFGVGNLQNVAIGNPQASKYRNYWASKWGKNVNGVDYETVYYRTPTNGEYASDEISEDKVNNLIVFTPVSVENALVLPQGDLTIGGNTVSRDQRTDTFSFVDYNETLAALKVCPLDPGLCEYRYVDCHYTEPTTLASLNFGSVTLDGSSNPVVKNTVNGKSYTLTGFSKASSGVLKQSGDSPFVLPFSELGLSSESANRLQVTLKVNLAKPASSTVLCGFAKYGFVVNSDGSCYFGANSTLSGYTDQVGATKKYPAGTIPFGSTVTLTLVFGFNNVSDCSLKVGSTIKTGTVSDLQSVWQTVNGVRTKVVVRQNIAAGEYPEYLSTNHIGSNFWLGGGLGANASSNLTFYTGQLVLLGGTTEHNSACYKDVTTHTTAKTHTHTSDCYAKEKIYLCGVPDSPSDVSAKEDYGYTGSTVTRQLKAGTYILEVWGAQGGTVNGGKGAYVKTTVTLNTATTVYINVGGQGSSASSPSAVAGGWNGGGSTGTGGAYWNHYSSAIGSGGGATDIRVGGSDLSSRVIVAGGGGGGQVSLSYSGISGYNGTPVNSPSDWIYGGWAGGSGQAGGGGSYCAVGGNGATQTGCTRITYACPNGTYAGAGTLGNGSAGASGTSYTAGAGGGGGYYGGQGGGSGCGGASGGGGSSYAGGTNSVLSAGNTVFTSPYGVSETGHSGDGYARITVVSGGIVDAGYTEFLNYYGALTCNNLPLNTGGSYFCMCMYCHGYHTSSCGSYNSKQTWPDGTYGHGYYQNPTSHVHTGSPGPYANGCYTQPTEHRHYYSGNTVDGWNTKTFNYTASVQSITLPAGTYKLEAWGAQGGNSGGLGGYASGNITLTTSTTLYIVTGGVGSSGSYVAGGYNGGGSSSNGYGSGGGATHFALSSGVLSTLSSNTSAVLLVAGGGAGRSHSGSAGAGGGTSGLSGSFGQGQSATGHHGGGGGGGYYGGAGGSGCSSYSYGGSSYSKSTLGSSVFTAGTNSGNGYAKITVINTLHECPHIAVGDLICDGSNNTTTDMNVHVHSSSCLTQADHQISSATIQYTGKGKTYSVPYSDYYTLEAWGPSSNASAGYSVAKVWLEAGTNLYCYVGGIAGYNGKVTSIQTKASPSVVPTLPDELEIYYDTVQVAKNSSLVWAGTTKAASGVGSESVTGVPVASSSVTTAGANANGLIRITPANTNLGGILDKITAGQLSYAQCKEYLGAEVYNLIMGASTASTLLTYTDFRATVSPRGVSCVAGMDTAVWEAYIRVGAKNSTSNRFTLPVNVAANSLTAVKLTVNTAGKAVTFGVRSGSNVASVVSTASTGNQVVTIDLPASISGSALSSLGFWVSNAGVTTPTLISKIEFVGHGTGSHGSSYNSTYSALLALTATSTGGLSSVKNVQNTSTSISGNFLKVVASGSNPRTQWGGISSIDTNAVRYIQIEFYNDSGVASTGHLYYNGTSESNSFSWDVAASTALQTVIIDTVTHTSYNTVSKKFKSSGSGWSGNLTSMYFDWTDLTSGTVRVQKVQFGGYGSATAIQPVMDFGYTGGVQSVTLQPGTYRLEVWGAQGGSNGHTGVGGLGGYAAGDAVLSVGTAVDVVVGGMGSGSTSTSWWTNQGTGGYNGGGAPGRDTDGNDNYRNEMGGGGGGYTTIRLNSTAVVTGGGGGGRTYTNNPGGRATGGAGGGSYYCAGSAGVLADSGGLAIGGVMSQTDETYKATGYVNPSLATTYSILESVQSGNGYARITNLSLGVTYVISASVPSLTHGTTIASNPFLNSATRSIILNNYTKIPDRLSNGSFNPIWRCKMQPLNAHDCDLGGCKTHSFLSCSEPHHRGQHYATSSSVCWAACCNDANHANAKDLVVDLASGDTYRSAKFLQLDCGFTVYFPNTGDFAEQPNVLGLATPSGARCKGYTNNMDCTRWTREKRIKFTFDVIFDNQVYLAGEWIDLDVPTVYFNFYLLGENPEMSNGRVQFECEAINCGTRAGVKARSGVSYSTAVSSNYANTLKTFIDTYADGAFLPVITAGFNFQRANTSNSDFAAPAAPAERAFGSWDLSGMLANKHASYDSKLRAALVALNKAVESEFEGDTNGTVNPHVTDSAGSINGRLKPLTGNDNKANATNRMRTQHYSSLHGGFKTWYLDVVGRIGNFAIVDSEDFRFANFFKMPVVDSDDEVGLAQASNWLVAGLVLQVDSSIQNLYLGDLWDIRGNPASAATRWLDTYGTQSWMTGKLSGINDTSRDINDPNLISQLMTSDVNNIDVLKMEQLHYGYNVYTTLETLGSYAAGKVQMVPKYYALKLDDAVIKDVPAGYSNVRKGTYIPLDVYANSDGVYLPVNLFGNAGSGNPNISGVKLFDTTFNLNWSEEAHRRNYTIEERARTVSVRDWYRSYDFESGALLEDLEMPEGTVNSMGTAQYLLLGGGQRTFAGSEYTYGGNVWVSRAGATDFGIYKNIGERIDEEYFSAAVQRWHGTVGVPSSAVFVPMGVAASPETFEYVMNDHYAIVCTVEIIAIGQVWSLVYTQPWFTSMDIYGDEFSTAAHYPGHRIETATGSYACPDCLPPVFAVYSANQSSELDIEIVGSH